MLYLDQLSIAQVQSSNQLASLLAAAENALEWCRLGFNEVYFTIFYSVRVRHDFEHIGGSIIRSQAVLEAVGRNMEGTDDVRFDGTAHLQSTISLLLQEPKQMTTLFG